MNMQTIQLANTGRDTTRLGYGCSGLMNSLGLRESLSLLDAAYDAGIRHFDTAPSYGFGAAERCLGEFLTRHSADVTITTKYGILPTKNQSLIGAARSIVKPLILKLPGIKQRLAHIATTAVRPTTNANFTVAEAERSIQNSLRELKSNRIDLFLLHEPVSESLRDQELLCFLEDCVKRGLLGAFGVGSGAAKIPALYAEQRSFCKVLQFEWSVFDAPVEYPGSFRIHHRSLSTQFPALHRALKERSDVCRRWSDEVGVDLANAESLSRLMLKAALELNPGSIILFSSKKKANIAANVNTAENNQIKDAAIRLYGVLQREGQSLIHNT